MKELCEHVYIKGHCRVTCGACALQVTAPLAASTRALDIATAKHAKPENHEKAKQAECSDNDWDARKFAKTLGYESVHSCGEMKELCEHMYIKGHCRVTCGACALQVTAPLAASTRVLDIATAKHAKPENHEKAKQAECSDNDRDARKFAEILGYESVHSCGEMKELCENVYIKGHCRVTCGACALQVTAPLAASTRVLDIATAKHAKPENHEK